MPTQLSSATHAFIRQDHVKPALSPPYRGPYPILQRGSHAYLMDMEGRQDWISLDRIKPAYTEPTDFTIYTRSGRASRPPKVMAAQEHSEDFLPLSVATVDYNSQLSSWGEPCSSVHTNLAY